MFCFFIFKCLVWEPLKCNQRFWPGRVVHVCSSLEPRHICSPCSLCVTPVCFSSVFSGTQARQSKCLNSEKMNVPKQPEEEDHVGNAGCVTRIPLWMKFLLVPCFIALRRTPNACFCSAVWKYQAHALLDFNIQVRRDPGRPQWDRISFSRVACY